MSKPLQGIIPPLTTPFDESGAVYEKGLRELVEFQIEGGSEGLFICGTYGSGPIMTTDERKQVQEFWGRCGYTIYSPRGTSAGPAADLGFFMKAVTDGADLGIFKT